MSPIGGVLLGVLVALVVAFPRAQDVSELDLLVDKLAQYLIAYESQLTTRRTNRLSCDW